MFLKSNVGYQDVLKNQLWGYNFTLEDWFICKRVENYKLLKNYKQKLKPSMKMGKQL